MNSYASLLACRSKSINEVYCRLLFGELQAKWKNPDRVLVQKILHKKLFIGTDKISEIVNDWDSDCGSFSELSDSDTCKVNSPFSSSSSSSRSEEEEVVQPEPDRGTKRIRRALPKRTNTDFELRWKEQMQTVQKLAFSGVRRINKNFQITQDSSPWDTFEILFSPEMFKLTQKETNRYATQQIIKKKQQGPLKPKSVFALWNGVSLQEMKKKSLR